MWVSPKRFGWGVGGWGELYSSFFWDFFEFGSWLTLQSPLCLECSGQLCSWLLLTARVAEYNL